MGWVGFNGFAYDPLGKGLPNMPRNGTHLIELIEVDDGWWSTYIPKVAWMTIIWKSEMPSVVVFQHRRVSVSRFEHPRSRSLDGPVRVMAHGDCSKHYYFVLDVPKATCWWSLQFANHGQACWGTAGCPIDLEIKSVPGRVDIVCYWLFFCLARARLRFSL